MCALNVQDGVKLSCSCESNRLRDISRGNVTKSLRRSEIYNDDFVVYLLMNTTMEKVLKISQHSANLRAIVY